ncbi:permease prefix domain 2-containing transporter [Fulvivirgaceae bacterium BMA12]|uniref:Permease prefix domain 2-containing transporter n=1 Tax=Agaribacillus aureus TaxID=3051825 RepID=A0ABT8L8H8_9BACT|nr:permease prefix domain 2-containing transporter [Fulvivirgaceae bacterium BMA12]
MMEKRQHPPRWATKLLHRICAPHLLEEIYGDLLEEYTYQFHKNGPRKAYWDYVFTVLGFIQPFAVRKKLIDRRSPLINFTMLRNYFITALRNIARYKTYSTINLAGLTLGLACSMLIFQYVTMERGADQFHEKVDQIYRVAFKTEVNGQTAETFSHIFYGAGEAFAAEIPELENFTRIQADFFQEGPTVSHTEGENKQTFKDIRAIIVDTTFLSIFSFPLLSGDPNTALQQPQAILLTEGIAQRMFGPENPVGKIVDYALLGAPQSFVVTGLLKDIPQNSHIQFDVVIPNLNFLNNLSEQALKNMAWGRDEYTTFVSITPNSDLEKIEKIMTDIVDHHIGENLRRNNIKLSTVLQPMKSVYFDRETDLGVTGFGSVQLTTRTGNDQIVYFLTVIGIITLVIAFISYVNLSTIRSLDRAKEVGIRKVTGANRSNIQWQFFFEAALINFTALVLALLLLLLLMPTINAFSQLGFTPTFWLSKPFLILFGGVFLLGVVLSGAYPALVLSSFRPITVLRGNFSSPAGRSNLRRVLIVLQYTPVIALLVCTTVVFKQLNYMQKKDIGLEMSELVTIRSPRLLPEGMNNRSAEPALKKEILALSSVASVSFTGNQAGRGLNFPHHFEVDSAGQTGIQTVTGTGVDHDFADVYGLTIVAGAPFTEGMSRNTGGQQKVNKVLVNETAVKTWGFKRNEDAVGQIITNLDGGKFYILGVLEDFNWSSVHKETQPVMFWYTPTNRFMTIKLNTADLNNSLMEVKSIYDQLFPEDVFHYEMTDTVFKGQYDEDKKFAHIFGIFSGVSILIASLGLFGLSAFTTARRSKEVGIRKVLGASVNHIVRLLSREFLFLVFIAFVLACPIAWMVMRNWLENFAFRIDLTGAPFIASGLGALLIAIITVSWKTFNAATTNPVNVLKNE